LSAALILLPLTSSGTSRLNFCTFFVERDHIAQNPHAHEITFTSCTPDAHQQRVRDPKNYTKPFTVKLQDSLEPDTELVDEFCLEGEQDYDRL
jgi:hypothetical protein